jgi:PleD family two-component response regulator
VLSISFDSFEPERQFNLGEIFTAPPATEIIGWREVLEADEEKPLRALVVDDEETVLATIADAVECCGAEVTTARSGNEAIAKLQTSYFDIVFTDLMMPGMSGFELITIAKEIAPQTEIHVITAYGSIENAVEATKRGAAGFVVKPDILTAIKEAIDKFGDQNHREETEGERNAGGGVLGSMAQVAVARVRDTKQLKRLAYTDPLTSLFNRTMFQFFLRNECSRCARHEGAFAVMVVDVDHFIESRII